VPSRARGFTVHGQNDDPAVLMRGTQNGRAITRLLQRAGGSAVTGRVKLSTIDGCERGVIERAVAAFTPGRRIAPQIPH
jgi:hypothetical protein